MDIIANRYQLQRKLGQGGMGAVYCALDKLSGEQVALKQVHLPLSEETQHLTPAIQQDYDLRLALTREFQTLASLRHPYIISVLDYGFDDARQPYFTMTYLPSAQSITKAAAQRPFTVRLQYLQELLEALIYLHRRGILHRDLKPDNILVAHDVVQVLDFGLAGAKGQGKTSGGTLAYSPPEVITQQPITEAADLYAVGVIAYELLTGKHPFEASNVALLVDSILHQPPDLSLLTIDDLIVAVIEKLLAKRSEERYRSAQAALLALSRALQQTIPLESPSVQESFLQAAAFVGRKKELDQLVVALQQAQKGRGSAWLIGGESGVGKSRLLNELRVQAMVEGALVLQGQGVADGGGLPYQLWREALRRLVLAGVEDDMTASILRPLVPDIEALLGRAVLFVPDLEGKANQQRLWEAITDLFRQAKQPIMLLLEDIHWANESIEVLKQLSQQIANLPLLVIATYRTDERPLLPQELPHLQPLILSRLNESEMAQLSQAMLGEIGTKPALLELLQRETEGNAFFLVEVVRALAEEAGRLSRIGEMVLPESLFPQGIQTIVQRRLAQLPQMARQLLTLAAVAGRWLDLALLTSLAQTLNMVLSDWLQVCAEAAVIDIVDERWRFAHDKLREGVLAEIAPEQRPLLHATVAQALEQLYADNPNQAGNLAFHYGQAQNKSKQRHYLTIAAQTAQNAFAHEVAVDYFTQLLALTETAQAQREIHAKRANMWDLLGQWDKAEAEYRIALAMDTQVPETDPEAIIARDKTTAACHQGLGKLLGLQGEYDTALMHLEEARTIAIAMDDKVSLAIIIVLIGYTLCRQGKFGLSRQELEAGMALSTQLQDKELIARAINNLAILNGLEGDYMSAQALYEQNLILYEEMRDTLGITRTLGNLGIMLSIERNYPKAKKVAKQGLALQRMTKNKWGVVLSLTNLGMISVMLGEIEQVPTICYECIQLCQAMGEKNLLTYNLVWLAAVNESVGQLWRATILLAATETLHLELKKTWELPDGKFVFDQTMTRIRESLSEADFQAAWLAGQQMPLAEVIAYALEEPISPQT